MPDELPIMAPIRGSESPIKHDADPVSAFTADPFLGDTVFSSAIGQGLGLRRAATWSESEVREEVRGPGPCRVASPVGSIDSYAQTTGFSVGTRLFAGASSLRLFEGSGCERVQNDVCRAKSRLLDDARSTSLQMMTPSLHND